MKKKMRKINFLVLIIILSTIFNFLFIPKINFNSKAEEIVFKRDYIVVLGTDALKTSVGLKSFVDYKSTNFDVTIVSMSDIAKQFSVVTDPVEGLRRYLDTKVQAVPPYVLLIGGLSDIPTTLFYTQSVNLPYDSDTVLEYDKPLSYFDKNGNGIPGQFDADNMVDTMATIESKFVIGRIPTSDINFLNKYLPALIQAEKKYDSNPALKGLVACSNTILPTEKDPGYSTDIHGEHIKQALSVNWLSLYEKEGDFISALDSQPLNEINFVNAWNAGKDIVYTDGHGGSMRMVWKDFNHNGIVASGESQYPHFYTDQSKLTSTVYFGYFEGCSTVNFHSSPVGLNIKFFLGGQLLNCIGTTGQVPLTIQDVDALGVFSRIAEGYSIGDSLRLVKESKYSYVSDSHYSMVVGDPSARLNSIPSSMNSVSSSEVIQPGQSIDLSWDSVNPTWAYNVQVGTSSDFTNLVKSEIVEAMSYTMSSLIPGSYYWRVRGMYDNGAGSWSAIVKFTITDPITLLVGSLLSETEINSITVSGSTNGNSVLVNGKKATISNEKFSIVIPLSEGNNNIVVAANKGEQTIQKSFIVIYRKPVQIEKTVIVLQIGKSMFTVNGVSQSLDSPPVIKNGRTLVPIRAIIESLGGTVSWDGVARKATVALGDTSLELWIGKSAATVNGKNTPIDITNVKVFPEIINGRTMLPLRFVTENLGATVNWEASSQTITITYLG